MMIRYNSEVLLEAVLLAASKRAMRVAVEGQPDTIDLTLRDGCWFEENGNAIEIEALMPLPATDCTIFCAELYPLTMAGRS